MTSKPSSRRPRASALAPRSWPSSPGLAMRTRMGVVRAGPALSSTGPILRRHQRVDLLGEIEVAEGERLGCVRREDEGHAVVVVNGDVGVVVGSLGGIGDGIDERDGAAKALELDRTPDRVALA